MKTDLPIIENKTILTPTSGFLGGGYTHTINPYSGCGYAGALCGLFCYAKHNRFITKGRTWQLYGVKRNIRNAYIHDFDRIKRPRRGKPKPLRVYMSSVTDPYVPQESRARVTHTLLTEMLTRPPDVIVIQTHSTLIARDIDLIEELSKITKVRVSITVETDLERIPGLPNHASSPKKRLTTLSMFKSRGIPTQATVSPLLPLGNTEQFATTLGQAAHRVILDHFLLGDGSKNGFRTSKTGFPDKLAELGFGEWNTLSKFNEVKDVFNRVLGEDRVLISCEGFNSLD